MKYIGKDFPIHDAENKAKGKAIYAGDLSFGKMLYIALLVSDYPHAIIKSIDVSEALKMPGVVEIMHCFNTTKKGFSRYNTTNNIKVAEQERIFTDHVRFVGDRIGAVIADDPVNAKLAVKKIKVEYEKLHFAENIETALTGVIDTMHPEGIINECELTVGEKQVVCAGDVTFRTQTDIDRISHIAMEPHSCTAYYDEGMHQLTIWSPNQSVYGMRYTVANFLDMPFNKIRIIKTTMGGSFGCKQECILEPVIGYIAKCLKQPVQLSMTRSEAMLSTLCRAPIKAEAEAIFCENGKLKSLEINNSLDAGAYLGSSSVYVKTIGEMMVRNYNFPYLHYIGRSICTNMPVSGGFRGWGTPECTMIMEHIMDKAAKLLNIDPIDIRILNAIQPQEIDPITHATFDESRLVACLKKGQEIFAWEERREKSKKSKNGRYKIGVGMACGGHINGHYPGKPDFSRVEMGVNEDGSIYINVTLHDHGCGTVRAMQIIAGEVLGIDPDEINVGEGDTFITPVDVGCYASRTIHVIGAAVEKCARALIDEIINQASRILDIIPNELQYENGIVSHKRNHSINISLRQIAIEVHYRYQKSIDVSINHISNSNPAVHGAHFAQVCVDSYTGFVQVEDYLAVHDIGRVINPEICVAQIEGAIQMGCSIALSESMTPKNSGAGRAVSSLKDYHILNAFDSPHIDVIFIEDPCNFGPFGAKSIGEVSFVPVSAAIVSAVNDAMGSDWNTIPLTPDRILEWIHSGEETNDR